ncbi:hypothetical protein N9Z27_00295 [Alphaproteobacteria bacterium]|nr:hypothetical protein [Alphaproteobacteria bacterium]
MAKSFLDRLNLVFGGVAFVGGIGGLGMAMIAHFNKAAPPNIIENLSLTSLAAVSSGATSLISYSRGGKDESNSESQATASEIEKRPDTSLEKTTPYSRFGLDD